MTKRQLTSLWACTAYLAFVLLRVLGRAMWGYLGLASEWANEASIPKNTVFSILTAESRFFWETSLLLGIGVAWLTLLALSVSSRQKSTPD